MQNKFPNIRKIVILKIQPYMKIALFSRSFPEFSTIPSQHLITKKTIFYDN